MTVALDSIPTFSTAEALAAAERCYALKGEALPLASERDQNFLIRASGGEQFVLKIANARDTHELLDFQNAAMRRIRAAQVGCRVPKIERSVRGADIESIVNGATGITHGLRLLSWIDGLTLAQAERRDAALLESIGAGVAEIDLALRDFRHPAMRRVLQWDLAQAPMAREHLGLVPRQRRRTLERYFERCSALDWRRLRHTVIHGDANDHNIMVDGGRMAGILDFGDMVLTATVCDLAIALAYALIGAKDPLAAAAPLVSGYQRIYPLDDAETRALPILVLARLSMSVCYSAHNRARNPEDSYQVVSEAGAWDLLDRLERPASDGTLYFAPQ